MFRSLPHSWYSCLIFISVVYSLFYILHIYRYNVYMFIYQMCFCNSHLNYFFFQCIFLWSFVWKDEYNISPHFWERQLEFTYHWLHIMITAHLLDRKYVEYKIMLCRFQSVVSTTHVVKICPKWNLTILKISNRTTYREFSSNN